MHYRKEERRKEAEERQAHYEGLTTQQKLDKLDSKLGEDVGAAKQRLKLEGLLLNEAQTKPGKKGAKK